MKRRPCVETSIYLYTGYFKACANISNLTDASMKHQQLCMFDWFFERHKFEFAICSRASNFTTSNFDFFNFRHDTNTNV